MSGGVCGKRKARPATPCLRGAGLALIGGARGRQRAVFAAWLAAGRILVFPTASAEPKAVGEESAQAFRSHGFATEVAPLTAANGRRWRTTPD